jgi:tetratricopeptide (TPR) repeat protein
MTLWRTLSLLVFCICLGWFATAFASGKTLTKEEREEATKNFGEADKYYKLQDYEKALAGYQKAYFISEKSEILFNIGQCHRLLTHKKEAVRSYQSFIAELPSNPLRPEAEKLIKQLEAEIAKENSSKPPPTEIKAGPKEDPKLPPTEGEKVITDPPKAGIKTAFLIAAGVGVLDAASFAVGLSFALTSTNLQDQGDVEGSRTARSNATIFGVTTDVLFVTTMAIAGAGYLKTRQAKHPERTAVLSPAGVAFSVRF